MVLNILLVIFILNGSIKIIIILYVEIMFLDKFFMLLVKLRILIIDVIKVIFIVILF